MSREETNDIYDHEAYQQGRRHEREGQEAGIDFQIGPSFGFNDAGSEEYQQGRRHERVLISMELYNG